jgi:hypothetical protein
MKRILVLALVVALIVSLAVGLSTAMAAKPDGRTDPTKQDVIDRSNGFPSGPHYNLNIHFKDWVSCPPDLEDGGHSVFLPADGEGNITYVSNKKSSVTDLIVLDACGIDGWAKVQLPAVPNGLPDEQRGYFVFGRILGKPNNGQGCSNGDCPSTVILDPAVVIQACNDNPTEPIEGFGDFTDIDDCELALGLILDGAVYGATPETYERFDPGTTHGKGKSKATDITSLFTWTGWVYDAATFDLDEDGDVDCDDVLLSGVDWDGSGIIDCDDFDDWVTYWQNQDPAKAWEFVNRWILDIADLVFANQLVDSDGGKLLQVRFYPMWTTEYIPPPTPTP